MKKSFTSHSPNSQHYFIRKKEMMKLPKFDFEYPPLSYQLIQSTKNTNKTVELQSDNSADSILLPIILNKIKEKPDQKELSEKSILVGNTYSQFQQRIVKPKIQILLDTFPIKGLKKKARNVKFNGIYFEDEKFSTDLDFQLKYANLRTYYNVINLSNNLYVQPTINIYKAYIGKGNNGLLVKSILKNRWWWSTSDTEKETANFLWQQLRNNTYIELQPLSNEETFKLQCNNFEDYNSTEEIAYQQLIPNPIAQELLKLKKKVGKNSKILNLEQAEGIVKKPRFFQIDANTKLHNHIQNNSHLGSKKNLFYNLKKYYESLGLNVFDYLPLTYHIRNREDLQKFVEQNQNQNIWIVKPAELTNRGHGIRVFESINDVQSFLKSNHHHKNGTQKSFIVQKYIENPLLYNQRKFDIRCYMLFTSINGQHKGYWYQDGYIRTSSKQFNLKDLTNKYIHLTNDAVQKHSEEYGKFEKGNKVSFEEINGVLPIDFFQMIYPQMKRQAGDLFRSTSGKLDPKRRENAFELYGLDFMIDTDYKVWLIEANTNPCLECSGPLLSKLIPELIDNLFKLVVDPLFPPPPFYTSRKFVYENLANKFQLIYDPTTLDLPQCFTQILIEEQ